MKKLLLSVAALLAALAIAIFSANAQAPIYEFPFNNTRAASVGTGTFSSTQGTSFTTDRNGNENGALNINGTGSTATLTGLPYGSAARTIAFWVKLNVVNAQYNFIYCYGTEANPDGIFVKPNEARRFVPNQTVASTHSANVWYHYVLTYDGTSSKIYKDGALISTAAVTKNTVNNSNIFKLGLTEGGGANWFNGAIDDLKIYNVALTEQQVETLYGVTPVQPPPTVWTLRNEALSGLTFTKLSYFHRPKASNDTMGIFSMGFTPHTSTGGSKPTITPSSTSAFMKTANSSYTLAGTTQFQAYNCDHIADTVTDAAANPGLVKDTTYIAGSAYSSGSSYNHASIRRRIGYMNEIGTAQWAGIRTVADKGYRGIATNKKYGYGRIVAVGLTTPINARYAFISSSKDNGSTWTDYTHTTGGKTGGVLHNVKWAGPATVYAVGSAGASPLLLKSGDTANTWQDVTINITGVTGLGSIYAHDSLTLWITCNDGKIIHSSDGGATFTEQATGTTKNLNAIWFANSQKGWAVGASGTIIKTTNGGQIWTRETFPDTVSNLTDVQFINDTNGVVLASNGAVYQYNPCYTTYSTVSITSCGSYVLNGNMYDTAGTYTATIRNSKGCDSVMTFTLTIIQPVRDTVSISACGSFTWANVGTYNSSTTVTHAFANAAANGCDSIVTLNLTIKSASAVAVSRNLNANGFFVFNGDTLIVGGLYTSTFVNAAGCDSVVTLNLNGNGLIAVYNFNNTMYNVGGSSPFSTSGTSFTTDKKGNANSALYNGGTTTASINGLPTGISARTVSLWFKRTTQLGDGIFAYGTEANLRMFGAYLAGNGITFQAYGNDIYAPVSGGVTLNVWHHLAITFELSGVIIYYDGVQIGSGSRVLNTGSSAFKLGNMQGDFDNLQIYNTALTAAQISAIYNADRCIKTTTKDTTVCGSFVWNNVTYTQSALITVDTTQTANDCDSIFRINLTVKQPTSSTHNAVICAGSSYIFNSITFTADTVYTTTLTNAVGCDSTVTLNLSTKQPVSNTVSLSACNSFTWTNATNDTYTRDTTVIYTFNNGCDSTVTLNLTINHPVTNNVNLSGCNEVGIVGFPLFTRDTTFIHTIANGAANGCDSVVTVNIVIIPVNINVTQSGRTLTAQQSGARYQWFDCDTEQEIEGDTLQSFTPAVSGRYLVSIKTAGCNLNSVCYTVDFTSIDELSASTFAVYPNPANSILNIEAKEATSIKIVNVLGATVATQELNAGKNSIDISSLPTGVYMLHTSTGSGYKAVKFVKE